MKKAQDNFSEGIYKGQMKNDVPHGKGTYISKWETKSGKKYKYFYKGDWVNGKKHGKAEHGYRLPTYVINYKGTYKDGSKNLARDAEKERAMTRASENDRKMIERAQRVNNVNKKNNEESSSPKDFLKKIFIK